MDTDEDVGYVLDLRFDLIITQMTYFTRTINSELMTEAIPTLRQSTTVSATGPYFDPLTSPTPPVKPKLRHSLDAVSSRSNEPLPQHYLGKRVREDEEFSYLRKTIVMTGEKFFTVDISEEKFQREKVGTVAFFCVVI